MGVVIDKANRTATRMLLQSCCHGQWSFYYFLFCLERSEAPVQNILHLFLSLSLAYKLAISCFDLTMDNGHPILSQYYVAGPIVSLH